MCRVLAYLGPEVPLEQLLITPRNSLVNQTLDPELHPQLQLAGWGFAAWSEQQHRPEWPLLYRRPTAAFYDDNVEGVVPSLRASTMLAHVRAADYHAGAVLADENCHPFAYRHTPWVVAQNGDVPHWKVLQRRLLEHCDDRYLEQMAGTTDTEFLYVLLLSLLEGDGDDDVQRAVEELVRLLVEAMRDLDLRGLAKLKMALVSPGRVVGINAGTGHRGETDPEGDWRELRRAEPGTDDFALGMLLEPMYLLVGRDVDGSEETYGYAGSGDDDPTVAIFASEPLTEQADDWSELAFGEIAFLRRAEGRITSEVRTLRV